MCCIYMKKATLLLISGAFISELTSIFQVSFNLIMKAIRGTDPLPEDVVIEILLRLPIKSLSRFKSVSQRWQALIRSPAFIRDHFRRESNRTGLLVCLKSALCSPDIDRELENPDEYAFSLFPDGTSESHEFADHRELLGVRTVFGIHGPCYGIYCVFLKDNSIALWNPATKTLRRVPDCPIDGEVGFGIDRLTDDLKLVVIDGLCEKPDYAIYSLTANSWELLKDGALVDPGARLERERFSFTFSNGFCYWMKGKYGDYGYEHFSIVAFDIHNQTFEEIEMPELTIDSSMEENYVEMYDGVYDGYEEVYDVRMNIEELVRDKMKQKLHWYDDSLAVLYCHYFAEPEEEVRYDLWSMKDNDECWIKISTITLPFIPMIAFGVWNMNHILAWSCDSKLIDYNVDSGNTTSLEFQIPEKVVDDSFLIPFSYKESLVSL